MLEGAALEEARERERALRAQDDAVRAANGARNTLEHLVYATRSSLEPGDGDLSAFVKAKDAEAVLEALEETEQWLYAAAGEGMPDKAECDRRASTLRQRLAEPLSRKKARASLTEALAQAEAAALDGDARLGGARDSLPASKTRHADNELASIRWFVADTREKLEASSSHAEGDYGSLRGKLPSEEGDVRKKMESLAKALAFTRKEHS